MMIEEIKGTGKADVIIAGDGAQKIFGGAGNDEIYGNAGNDILIGGVGSDFLSGGVGADKLFGGSGADKLVGGSGNDKLVGASGSDTLIGGSGVDTMTGGSGADKFVFSAQDIAGNAVDIITDFSNKDTLAIDGFTYGVDTITNNGDGTVTFTLVDSSEDLTINFKNGFNNFTAANFK